MENQNVLFEEYEELKPLLKIGSLGLVKYQKPERKKRGVNSHRAYAMKQITDEMEKESPFDMKLLMIRLSHVPTEDLYFMHRAGLEYRNKKREPFSRYVWGSVKPKE